MIPSAAASHSTDVMVCKVMHEKALGAATLLYAAAPAEPSCELLVSASWSDRLNSR